MSNSHVTQFPTVKISEKRREQSPYVERWRSDQCVMGVYANRLHPATLGTNATDDYWKLRRSVALYDVPERPVSIQGPDAVHLLERVLTRPIASIRTGRGVYGIACQPDGGIVMDGVLFRLADDHFWYVQADGDIENWMTALSIREDGSVMDVTVNDPGSRVLQIQGPQSHEFLAAATGAPLPENFSYFAMQQFDLGGQTVWISNSGWTGELGIEIYSHAGLDHLRLWDYLMESGAPFNMTLAAGDSMGPRRVEAGILDNKTDFDQTMTPFAAGLGAFVNFDNPRFIGRAALENADRMPLLCGITCASATPGAGDEIWLDGRKVGRLTVGEWSPTLRSGIGYARFDGPPPGGGEWTGRKVIIRFIARAGQEREGLEYSGRTQALPFLDPEKRLPRGQALEADDPARV